MSEQLAGAPSGRRMAENACGCIPRPETACVPGLSSPADRLAALRAATAKESEPLVTVTHLLRLCRDDHPLLWSGAGDPSSRARVIRVQVGLEAVLPAPGTAVVLEKGVRRAMAAALEEVEDLPSVLIARALAELLDIYYGHTFAGSFRRRSPYQPRVGDPVPLGGVDLRQVTVLPPTAPPWRLANRLDETRRVRLAGEWAAQFRTVFDYCLADTLDGVVGADTVIATCHPNTSLDEFDRPGRASGRSFPVGPADPHRQRKEIDRLLCEAVAARASIAVLPELCVTESMAFELQDWVRRPNGLRLLVAGSYHHQHDRGSADAGLQRRRNTAMAWIRGSDRPISHDKHSPADRPLGEDIQPQGWPELRIYVTTDGWHLVLAICRDLLNPLAVHAITEAGANLVLAPAMSETLVPFGGPVAQLVAANQAVVVVANNPAEWPNPAQPGVRRRPARALYGHPGFGQQARSVPGDTGPGLARLYVQSGELGWRPSRPSMSAGPGSSSGIDRPTSTTTTPAWVAQLIDHMRQCPPAASLPATVTLRTAAVLVLLIDDPAGPRVVLTRRAPDLMDYPGRLVFPGGATDRADDGPVATALREAHEEIGLDPGTVDVLGVLPAHVLIESGFLVTPVLAWAARAQFPDPVNLAEVDAVVDVPLIGNTERSTSAAEGAAGPSRAQAIPESGSYGRMTAVVLDLLADALLLDARWENRRGSSACPSAPE